MRLGMRDCETTIGARTATDHCRLRTRHCRTADCRLPTAHLPITHSMTTYQLRWLLLLVTGLFALSGASCPQMLQQYTQSAAARVAGLADVGAGHRRGEPEQLADSIVFHQSRLAQRRGLPVAVREHRLPTAAAIPLAGGNRLRRRTRPGQQRRAVLVLGETQPAAGGLLLPPRSVRQQPGAADDAVRAAVADRGAGGGGIRPQPAAPDDAPAQRPHAGSTPSATRPRDRSRKSRSSTARRAGFSNNTSTTFAAGWWPVRSPAGIAATR